MKRNIRIGNNSFCGACGLLKSVSALSDCVNCFEREKTRMINEFNEDLEFFKSDL